MQKDSPNQTKYLKDRSSKINLAGESEGHLGTAHRLRTMMRAWQELLLRPNDSTTRQSFFSQFTLLAGEMQSANPKTLLEAEFPQGQSYQEWLSSVIKFCIGIPKAGMHERKITSRHKFLLKLWYNSHRHYPYPTEGQKNVLSMQSGLSISQINTWFTNTRRRQRGSSLLIPCVSGDIAALES